MSSCGGSSVTLYLTSSLFQFPLLWLLPCTCPLTLVNVSAEPIAHQPEEPISRCTHKHQTCVWTHMCWCWQTYAWLTHSTKTAFSSASIPHNIKWHYAFFVFESDTNHNVGPHFHCLTNFKTRNLTLRFIRQLAAFLPQIQESGDVIQISQKLFLLLNPGQII